MKSIFFNENGIINIDEAIAKQPSFLKIMEDGYVTDSELSEQSEKVLNLFKQVDQELNESQKELIKDLLVETNVLQAIYQYYQLKNIKQYGNIQ